MTYLGSAPTHQSEVEGLGNGFSSIPDAAKALQDSQLRTISKLRLLWSRRRFIARAATLGALLGILIAFLLPKQYKATTQLMPPDDQSGAGMAVLASLVSKTGGGLGGFAGDLLGMKSSGALFIGILHSRTVEDSLVEKFDLREVYAVRLNQDARTILEDRTTISEDRKSGIISISVMDRDPVRAASIARAYTESLDHLISSLSTSSAHRERVFLEGRLALVKKDLDDATKDLSQFESKNATIDINVQGRTMMDAAATLMGQLVAAESELKGLQEIYSPNNVRVRTLQARVAELRKQLQQIGGSKSGEAGSASSSGVAGNVADFPSIRQLPLLGATYVDLYRRAKIQESVFETLTQEYELSKVQEAKETPSVKVLDEAAVPEKKSFPPRMLITVSVMFMFASLAIILCFAKDAWDEIDASDPRKAFANELLQRTRAELPPGQPLPGRLHAIGTWIFRSSSRHQDAKQGNDPV